MVAAIRKFDIRQITSIALATDRHSQEKLSKLLGPAADADRSTESDITASNVPQRPAVRRRFL